MILPAVAVGVLTLAPASLGAALTATSPADGVRVQTTDTGANLNLSWQADTSGCAESAFSVTRVFTPQITSQPTALSSNPSGSSILTFPGPVRRATTYSWFASTICNGAELRSSSQTFTLLPPRPHARLQGHYQATVRLRGARNGFRWAARPRCPTGTCKTVLNIPGLGNVIMTLNKRKKLYRGRVTGGRAGRAVTCELNGGRRVVRGVARGRLDVVLRVSDTEIKGAQTFARGLRGRLVGTFRRNAKGARLGCPVRYRLNQPVVLGKA
jgi:hypothetical protein